MTSTTFLRNLVVIPNNSTDFQTFLFFNAFNTSSLLVEYTAGSARNNAKKGDKRERKKKKWAGAEGEIIHPNTGN